MLGAAASIATGAFGGRSSSCRRSALWTGIGWGSDPRDDYRSQRRPAHRVRARASSSSPVAGCAPPTPTTITTATSVRLLHRRCGDGATAAANRSSWFAPSHQQQQRQRRRLPGLQPHLQYGQQRRRFGSALYGFGAQWTGSLGLGPDRIFDEEAPELGPEEDDGVGMWRAYVDGDDDDDDDEDWRKRRRQAMVRIPLPDIEGEEGEGKAAGERERVATAAAGWGHSALVLQRRGDDGVDVGDHGGGGATEDSMTERSTNRRRLVVCGRPHDFQAVLRLRRMPAFMRNFSVRQTLRASIEGERRRMEEETNTDLLHLMASYLAGEQLNFDEEEKRRFSIVPSWMEVSLPDGDEPAVPGDSIPDAVEKKGESGAETGTDSADDAGRVHTRYRNTLAASAGFTAVIGRTSGALYAFGLNHRGQCGVGGTTNFVWEPAPVMGLGPSFAAEGREFLRNEYPVVDVSLGLQHGVALDSAGGVYAWGKGERAQLGQGPHSTNENCAVDHALRVVDFCDPYATLRQGGSANDNGETTERMDRLSPADAVVRAISAGMNHSAVVTASNLPYVWGKNCAPPRPDIHRSHRNKRVVDAGSPRYVPGVPPGMEIVDIACGSHHTAFLLEDGSVYAIGVATDNAAPVVEEAVEILPPGVIDGPVRSFRGHFDRTTIVAGRDDDRRQVLEMQLWSHEELRRNAAVIPSWAEWLEEEEKGGGSGCGWDVKEVHRGWMHTLVVAEERMS